MAFWDQDPPVSGAGGDNGIWRDAAGKIHMTIRPGNQSKSDGEPAAFWASDPVAQGAEPPGDLGSSIPRQLGLTARAAVSGPAAIPMLVGDAANSLVNFGSMGLNKLGADIPMLQMPSAALQRGMTSMGVPEPQGLQERAVQAGASALSGAGAAGLVARALANIPGIAQAAPMLADMLAQAPMVQALGAGAGAAASEYAKEQGVKNPLALGVIAAMTGMAPGTAATIGQRVGGGVAQAVRPLTSRGREILVGEALNTVSNTPAATAARLRAAAPVVPGSMPMVSDVAQDAGLIGAESALKGMDTTGILGTRRAAQNQARMQYLDTIARDEGTLLAAQDKRGRTFREMAEPAFRAAGPTGLGTDETTNPILARIAEIRRTPEGARGTVREALEEAEAALTEPGIDYGNPRVLYAIRKDLDLLRTGKLTAAGKSGRERGNMVNAREQLDEVVSTIDDVLENSAPGYRDYMRMFAKRSIPLEQLKALQSLREKAVIAAPDPVNQQDILSQAKFKNLLRNNVATNPRPPDRGPGAAVLRGNFMEQDGKRAPVLGRLSRNQLLKLDRIAEDLDRGAATSAATIRTPGSDTFKNMSVAAVIGRVLGDETGKAMQDTALGKGATKALSFLYRIPDREIQLLMLEVWQDPSLAGRLMQQATRANIENIGTELQRRAAAQAQGAALYGRAP